MKDYILINDDNFDISSRLKEIDKSYYLVYSISRKCYEVHSNEQVQNSYCFTVPFDTLDERTILFALKTRSTNRDKLIEEIEENNRIVEQKNIKKQVNMLKEALYVS